jgi:thiamine pyrophosphate-dependent acetolactate synthase large subunit-like protein
MADQFCGADAFLAQLVASGVEWIFGNPGTTEQQLLSRIPNHPQLGFVVALHESVAVAAAEGYARASGQVGIVELHAGPGLGNGMGMLYNAAEGSTPLVVYVGQSEQAGLYLEPTLSGDLVAQAHPLAKWAVEVRTADEIPQVVRRAIKVASTDPCGPVVVAVPMDLMRAPCAAAVVAPSLIDSRVAPSDGSIAAASDAIAAARRPALLVGDGVARADALTEVSELAWLLGAPIFGGFMSQTCIEPDEPLNAGRLPSIDAAAAASALGDYDLIIAIGTKVLSNVFTVPGLPLGDRPVVHLGLDTWELAKNQPSVVVYGDERAAIRALLSRLAAQLADRAGEISLRREREQARISQARMLAVEADRRRFGQRPMTPEQAVSELAARMPADAILVDESLTAYSAVGRYFRLSPGGWFRLRGGGIGAGLPMPIGIQLACPGRRVVSLVGDGSALYTITALWTAAHHRLPIVWVILNNASYRILKENVRRDGVDSRDADRLLGANLTDPSLDFVALAAGMGVSGRRVTEPEEVGAALAAALARHEPYLLDVAISGQLSGT